MAVGFDLQEELEVCLASRKSCEIVFKKEGARAVIRGRIANLSESDDVPFLTMDSGLVIRLGDLIEVNGKTQENLC